MSSPNPNPPIDMNAIQTAKGIMEIIQNQQDQNIITALKEMLRIYDNEITIAGDKYTVSNLESITEYPNVQYTKTMVKNETWRKSIEQVFHLDSIDDEKIVGFMDMQFILKMRSHKRKGAQEYINGLKRESANTEIIPQNTRTKRFFGMR